MYIKLSRGGDGGNHYEIGSFVETGKLLLFQAAPTAAAAVRPPCMCTVIKWNNNNNNNTRVSRVSATSTTDTSPLPPDGRRTERCDIVIITAYI